MRPLEIVVVGGGTAGWITASLLQQKLGRNPAQAVNVTVVESARIGILGVGEATLPTIRRLLKMLAISETEFMAETGATFKQGILYRDWARQPSAGDKTNNYFHPFDYSNVITFNTTHWWLEARADLPAADYAQDVTSQARVALSGKAPRRAEMPPFEGPLGYAYHIDAERFAEFLAGRAMRLGVKRIRDDVLKMEIAENGSVKSVVMRENGVIDGDFFVDCTGFSRFIAEKALGIKFVDYGKHLFCDRAVALRVPMNEAEPIRPFTTATAKAAGWIWDIDLQSRHGTGYVYSSRHLSPEAAETELRHYVGPRASSLEARHLTMRVGRSERFWQGNMAVLGLAGGFIEPMESTGIFLIEAGAVQLAEYLQSVLGLVLDETDDNPDVPSGRTASANYLAALETVSRSYDTYMISLYEEILDFIKIHYQLSNRSDTEFWKENRQEASSTSRLLERLELWKIRPPSTFDFTDRHAVFNEHNWLYVMLGMGWRPSKHRRSYSLANVDAGKRLLQLVGENTTKAMSSLPAHRDYFMKARAGV